MDNPLISVIIPVYNVEEYLEECLNSCICQGETFGEFICVDDGSTDSCAQILADYASKDKRIKVIRKPNGGLSSARNAGLAIARGEWIMFLDSDDKLKGHALQTIKSKVEKNDCGDIVIYCADTFPVGIEKEKWYKKTLQFSKKTYGAFTPDILFKERGSMPYVWRQAYRKELLDRSGVLFDETVRYGEDVLFQMEVFPQATGFHFISDILISYRLNREGSIMNKVQDDMLKTVDHHYDMIRHVAQYWQEKNWLSLYGTDFLFWVLKFTILKVMALPSPVRKVKAEEMFDRIIKPFGLEAYKKDIGLNGKAMWTAFQVMCGFGK